MLETVEIDVTGIVQAVGFRPFLYNLARKRDLKGVILNRGNAGVRLTLQGTIENINLFVKDIRNKSPKISFIESIDIRDIQSKKQYDELRILKSEEARGISLTLPPDIAICSDCLKDMRNPNLPKYHNYPFIACAVCGPRYTTVKELPYDRERTTMEIFPFCENAEPESCIQEYSDFRNRRFHAQTFACSVCGPRYQLYDKSSNRIETNSIVDILKEVASKIHDDQIVAVQGIGGVHLVCLASSEKAILKVRRRKGRRKYKPFAVMVPNLELIDSIFNISKKERDLLQSFRKPIVLIKKKLDFNSELISNQVAPGLNNVGLMLPYSGIHHLLFDHVGEKPLVYTSGNKSNIPMGIDNNQIFEQLRDIADVFLLHDRPIYQRADDSVLRVHDDKVKLIRRSRGFVPEYIPLPFDVNILGALATGPELAVTGAVLRRNRIFPTQHIGNVTHLETHDFLKASLFHMKNLLQIKDTELEFIACDLHPGFITSRLARELSTEYGLSLYPIQHHFAHILSLMAENNVRQDEKIVGISTDGVGYGDDGNVWGGEILLASYKDYSRLGHLKYQPMIGGDRATKYPARMAASIILNTLGIEEAKKDFEKLNLKDDLEYFEVELDALLSQYIQSNGKLPAQNIPLSSSTGRIFDSVSYLLGASNIKTYRGEPAMRLEGLAARGNSNNLDMVIEYEKKNGTYIIDTSKLILDIIDLLSIPDVRKEDIAARFHVSLAEVFAEVAIKIAQSNAIEKIGLTGGVAYNYSFPRVLKEKILENGIQFLEHDKIPPGDAGISTGQLIGGFFNHLK